MRNSCSPRKRIGLMGPFGFGNLGDAAIQQAVLQNIRRYDPDAEIFGFSLDPEDTHERHGIQSFPIGRMARNCWLKPQGNPEYLVKLTKIANRCRASQNRVVRLLGRLVLSIALECLAILNASKTVQDMDYFIVSGGGQLDDYWGGPSHHPYTMLVWSLIAKLCKARLRFVSVGAGPIDHKLSRWFIKVALCLADYRSYRDEDSKRLIEKIGFKRNDPVYPDLAHSLEIERYCGPQSSNRTRLLVGIGPMAYFDPRVWPERDLQVYMSYLVKLALFIVWLLQNGHDILLFTSEVGQDPKVTADLRELLTEHGVCTTGAESRVMEQPIETVDDLMSQLAITDLVVASRFHGVLLAQLLSKPVLALSYHKKIDVLMADMGQAEYCLPINCFDLETLKERFISMEANRQAIKAQMAARTKEYREALDEQYQYLFRSE